MTGRRAPWRALLGVAIATLLLFGARVTSQPLQPYGSNSAQYIEHALRLELADLARSGLPMAEVLRAADETVMTHPPGLHLATSLAHPVLGRGAEAILWTGLGWLGLLSLALAGCAWGLTRRIDRAVAAGAAGLLFPAGLAAATRYHYDLPMTALIWSAVAVILVHERAPLLRGLLAGALLVAATAVKWTALPLGAIAVVGALASSRATAPRRLVLAGALVGVWGLAVAAFQRVSIHSFRAGSMAVDEGNVGAGASDPVLLSFGRRLARELLDPDLGTVLWYPLATATALLSPLLLGASLPLVRAWWRHRTGARLVGVVLLGHWALLTFGVAVKDERFWLTAAPALLLVAAIADARPRLEAIAVVVALAVSLEFHALPLDREPGSLLLRDAPALTTRGPFLADSVERRGWSSRATTPSNQGEDRRALRDLLDACQPGQLGYVSGPGEQGDTWWLRYRAALEGHPLLVLGHGEAGGRRFWWPDPDTHARAGAWDRLGFSWDHEPPRPTPAALAAFAPTVALSHNPPGPRTPLDGSWRVIAETGGAPSHALFGRGAAPCPGPAHEAPPR